MGKVVRDCEPSLVNCPGWAKAGFSLLMLPLTACVGLKTEHEPLAYSAEYPLGPNCGAAYAPENWTPSDGFPSECEAGMATDEYVIVKWDLSEEGGHPVNVGVTQTTNACFNETAMDTIKQRVFPPVAECSPNALTKNLRERFHYTRVDDE